MQIMFTNPQKLDIQQGDVIILNGEITNFSANADGVLSIDIGDSDIEIEEASRDAHSKLRGAMDTALSSRQPIPRIS